MNFTLTVLPLSHTPLAVQAIAESSDPALYFRYLGAWQSIKGGLAAVCLSAFDIAAAESALEKDLPYRISFQATSDGLESVGFIAVQPL
jgi:hypothetical protein